MRLVIRLAGISLIPRRSETDQGRFRRRKFSVADPEGDVWWRSGVNGINKYVHGSIQFT